MCKCTYIEENEYSSETECEETRKKKRDQSEYRKLKEENRKLLQDLDELKMQLSSKEQQQHESDMHMEEILMERSRFDNDNYGAGMYVCKCIQKS